MTATTPRTIDATAYLEATAALVIAALEGHPDWPAGTTLRMGQLLVSLDGGRVHMAIRATPEAAPIPVAVVIVNPSDQSACPVVTIDAVGLARSIVGDGQLGHD